MQASAQEYLRTYADSARIAMPDDLAHYEAALKGIIRFTHPEYAPGIFTDDVLSHVQRMVAFSRTLEMINSERICLERTLWVHDIPEITIDDFSIVQKDDDPDLMSRLEIDEERAARQLLSESDIALLADYNRASAYIKGRSEEIAEVPRYSLVAKVLDGADGNITFHRCLSKWVASPAYTSARVPPERALRHTFDGLALFGQRISLLDPQTRVICANLVRMTQESVRELWAHAPRRDWPVVVSERIG